MTNKSKVQKASEDSFNSLHNLVTNELIKRLEGGEASTADIRAAIEWLSKNDVTGVAMPGSPLDNLRHLVPVVDPELIRNRMNGTPSYQ